jgi:hypothetical protein
VNLYKHFPMPLWRSAQLVKHRDNFTFTLYIQLVTTSHYTVITNSLQHTLMSSQSAVCSLVVW